MPFEDQRPSGTSHSPTAQASSDVGSNGVTREYLIGSFYSCFFASHPCVLPETYYEQRRESSPREVDLLDSVMQFIGSVYCSETGSGPFEDHVKVCLNERVSSGNPFDIQAILLYATALYWRNEADTARQLLDDAIDEALSIGLHLKSFASLHSDGGNSVLAESWRRLWWQMYVTDAHMTAIVHDATFKTSQKAVAATVDLPCEEDEYIQGVRKPLLHLYKIQLTTAKRIATPRTLSEYEDREFQDEGERGFSSFAYLIALVRGFDETILGRQRTTSAESKAISINADFFIRSWLTLLPRAKRAVVGEDGTVDYLMFKAMVLIPVFVQCLPICHDLLLNTTCRYVTDVHRALSTLEFDPIESVSTCSPPPPPEHMSTMYRRDAPIHTSKILHSIETMLEILLLPSRMSSHTPFMICMISSATIAYLSACKHVFRGEQLAVARRRIKVAMGALTGFAEVWSRGASVLHEVKIIARTLLGVGSNTSSEVAASASSYQGSSGGGADTGGDENMDLFSGLSLPHSNSGTSSELWSYFVNMGGNSLYRTRSIVDQQAIYA